ncbi:hypothetical protein WJX82_004558 [Trebouxia sp. C0006]
MSCHQVQHKLRAIASSEAYTDATPLRLLSCDQGCKSAKISKQEAELSERAESSETSAAAHAEQRESSSASAARAIAETQKGPRRRNRAERAALQEEQDLLDQQQARRKRWWTIVWWTVQGLACSFSARSWLPRGIPALRRRDLWDLINNSRIYLPGHIDPSSKLSMLWSLLAAVEKAQDCEARQSCAVCGATEMASQVQGWLRHNHGRPYMRNSCSTLEVMATGPCAACGMTGRPSAPGMFGGQQHGSSLCTGCRYKKRYQEWACIACGATGLLGGLTRAIKTLPRLCGGVQVLEHNVDVLLAPTQPPARCFAELAMMCLSTRMIHRIHHRS